VESDALGQGRRRSQVDIAEGQFDGIHWPGRCLTRTDGKCSSEEACLEELRAARTAVERVARDLGTSLVATAEGIHRVVNTNMAEGIRLVSVRRGADPRRFALLSFGGAAGLHVTEVARMLEIDRVVVPRVAAVLSAWGMLANDLRYELVRTYAGPAIEREPAAGRRGTRRKTSAELRRLFDQMEREGRARLGRSFAGDVVVRRAVDMRYGEQVFEIQVPLDGGAPDTPDLCGEIVARFHRRHEELYTYSAPGQDVVLVNARVAVIGRLPALPAEPARAAGASLAPVRTRRIYLGRWTEAPVYDMDALWPGQDAKGPAIFESSTTTVLLRDGERAEVTPNGWLDLRLAGVGA
jgi:N-methylhydantoinase A